MTELDARLATYTTTPLTPKCYFPLRLLAFRRCTINNLILRREVDAHAVDAVALVRGRGVALALEDVAQVPTAVGTDDLGAPHAKGAVGVAGDGPRDAVKVRRPAAARLELVVGRVQRRLAAGAGVDACVGEELVVLAGPRGLSALLTEDAELFGSQDGTPLVVGSLVGIRHVAGRGGAGTKETAEEGDGGHRLELMLAEEAWCLSGLSSCDADSAEVGESEEGTQEA